MRIDPFPSSSSSESESEWKTSLSERPLKIKQISRDDTEWNKGAPWKSINTNEFPYNAMVHGCPIKEGCICSSTKPRTKSLRRENNQKYKFEREWKRMFDKAWCICLQERNDRLMESSDQFHRYGLCRMVQYYRPVRPTKEHVEKEKISSIGRYGVWTSHHIVARLASQNERTAVFEDDLMFFHELMTLKRMKALVHHLDHHLPRGAWDMVKLGQVTLSGKPVGEGCGNEMQLYKARSVGMHAFIWSRRGANKLAQMNYRFAKETANGGEYDVDTWTMDRYDNYVCSPQLVCQSDSQTNNTENHSFIAELVRGQVSPFLFRQQRHHAKRMDFLAYNIWPVLGWIFMILTSLLCFMWLIKIVYMVYWGMEWLGGNVLLTTKKSGVLVSHNNNHQITRGVSEC